MSNGSSKHLSPGVVTIYDTSTVAVHEELEADLVVAMKTQLYPIDV